MSSCWCQNGEVCLILQAGPPATSGAGLPLCTLSRGRAQLQPCGPWQDLGACIWNLRIFICRFWFHTHTEKKPWEPGLFLNIKVVPRGLWGLTPTETGHRSLPLNQQGSLRHLGPGAVPTALSQHPLPTANATSGVWSGTEEAGAAKGLPTTLQLSLRTQQDNTACSHRGSSKLAWQPGEVSAHPASSFSSLSVSQGTLFIPVLWATHGMPSGQPASQPVQSPSCWI